MDLNSLTNRMRIVESEVMMDKKALENAPTDPVKRQKYLEKRLVLSERSILRLSQELALYRTEKKQAVEDLIKKVEAFSSMKHDFNQKAEFLYSKITDNSKILVE